ncbi:MAG: radical SAM protein [Candidatus Omnitrophota bacterium]|nr:radical SAM protein [Candidatus Omnitrophota bacterium]
MPKTHSTERQIIAEKIRGLFSGNCRRVLLVQPVQLSENKIDIPIARNKRYYMYPPYSLGVLSANLKKRGYEPYLLDLNYEVFEFIFGKKDGKITQEEITAIWQEKLESTIKAFDPDVVGLSCTFTMGHELLARSADFIKEHHKDLPVVAGGVHVTNAPKNVLTHGENIDLASLYESDLSFCDMLDFVNGKTTEDQLTQIGTLVHGEYKSIGDRRAPAPNDLNVIPDYGKLPVGKYNRLGEIGTFRYWRPAEALGGSVLSNRGCRAKCTFCSVANFNGPGVRARDVRSVVDEIEDLKTRYNITHITWLDDDLFYNVDRTLLLFKEIAKRKLGITWDASNGVIGSAAVVHNELVPAAAESGCIGMYFGIESGNDEILRRIKKPSGVKHFKQLGIMMNKYPQIFTRGFLIIGFPKETLGQLRDTIELSREMNLDWYTVQLLTPLPSTPIYNEMVELGMIEQDSLNTDGEGFTMFSVRESERQRRTEDAQRAKAKQFFNIFEGRLDVVPTKEELNDLWFLVDYDINYGKILNEQHPLKLEKMRRFLTDVSDRMTFGNPISNLFLGIIEAKLDNPAESKKRKLMAKDFFDKSEYWQQRFSVLGLEKLFNGDAAKYEQAGGLNLRKTG